MERTAIRRIVGMLLLVALLCSTLLSTLILVDFTLRRDEIVRTSCVQRSRPAEKNCCQGRCQLDRQLKKAAGQHERGGPQAPREAAPELLALLPAKPARTILPVRTCCFPHPAAACAPGHVRTTEHVPRRCA